MVRELAVLVPVIARQDADLAKQLRRAASSVPLNLSEGLQRVGGDRLHLWRVAAGSNAEIKAALKTAIAWRYLDEQAVEAALAFHDRVTAMLFKMTH
jgi:four helix bundle protein